MMGREGSYPEEGPRHVQSVKGFWIDRHEVTNQQFEEFVRATGYVTVAEKPVDPSAFGLPEKQIPAELLEPGSAVFTQPNRPTNRYMDWWKYVPGAQWRQPYGPGGANAVPLEPVVHLALADMQAYADWRGGRLPSEPEWEFAASAGQAPEQAQPGSDEANSWQGVFPMINEGSDGFREIAPVGCYLPNANDLYDTVGNVWEVTSDEYSPEGHKPATARTASYTSAEKDANRPVTMKGGSYLCAPNYCMRYRPQSRQPRDATLGASNVGFRLVYDRPPS